MIFEATKREALTEIKKDNSKNDFQTRKQFEIFSGGHS